jgi:Ni,Fe-hydrogenase I small subunit
VPVAPLTLVSAAYDNDSVTLTLTFDRAIDIAGIVVGEDVIVDDGAITGSVYEADGATLVGPESVRFTLTGIGDSTSSITTLTATSATGIVAVDNGGTWGGVTALELPWP